MDAITWQVDLLRLDAATRAKVLPLLVKMQRELVANVANTEWGKARAEKLIKEAKALIALYYKEAQGELIETTTGLARVTANATAKSLANSLPVGIEPTLPTLDMIKSIAGDAIIQGATQADWWARQADDTAWRFAAQVRQGLVAGETNQQIIRRVTGALDISRKNAAALVHTSVQTVANEARQAVFKRNEDVIKAYVWVTALDSHVCEACAARADLKWDINHEPIGHSMQWAVPPIHFSDRCLISVETKTYKELGVDLPEPAPGMRASRDGPVPITTTFADWLAGRTAEQQEEQFGKGRAKLFRDGKITLQDLTRGDGRPLTLKQLEERHG
jgi:hypothetical protein